MSKLKLELKTLTFRELEPLTSSFLTVFLSFLLSRVACDEARSLQCRSEVRVVLEQGTGNAVTNRSGLSGLSTAVHIYKNVEFTGRFREVERLTDDHLQRFVWKVAVEFASVDLDVACSGTEVNTCCRSLSAAGAVILNICHKSVRSGSSNRQYFLPQLLPTAARCLLPLVSVPNDDDRHLRKPLIF